MDDQNKQLAFLFPGQGSQSVGMLSELAQSFALVKDVFAEASDVLGYDAWDLAQNGPEEKLNQTEFTQPVLLAADVAVWRCWCEHNGVTPAFMAGHSLGEYAAMVCAGVIRFAAGLRLVANRGRYMQRAVTVGKGGMAAIVGLSDEDVVAVCQEAAQNEVVSPANYNSIGQVVVAGDVDAVKRAVEIAKQRGAKMAKFIPVSVPSHCALMKPAAERLANDLTNVQIHKSSIDIIQNVDVAVHHEAQKIRDNLVLQLTHPVRWVETVQWLAQNGIDNMVECGPGVVLAKLNKRITRDVPTHSINDADKLQATLTSLNVGELS